MRRLEQHGITTASDGAVGGAAPTGARDHLPTRKHERGEVTASNVIIIPLVMLLCFAVVQYAVAWHAKNALNAAAEDGLRAAQTNPLADAARVAKDSLTVNAGFVANPQVTQSAPQPGRLTVTISGNVAGPFPGMTWTLRAQATGPTESFREQGNP